jgi:hypothetical protein
VLNTVFTHQLPGNVGIHIGNGQATWLNEEISQYVAANLHWQRLGTEDFIFVVCSIYTESERAIEGSGW